MRHSTFLGAGVTFVCRTLLVAFLAAAGLDTRLCAFIQALVALDAVSPYITLAERVSRLLRKAC